MRFWDQYTEWEAAEADWGLRETEAKKKSPLKVLNSLPEMPGITPKAAKFLRWKSLKWILKKDHGFKILKKVLKRPFHHLCAYLRSIFSKRPFIRQGDFYLYGIDKPAEFEKLLVKPNTLLILGFSYCHKPFECPAGRFSDACTHDLEHPACRQCFIGKCTHAAPQASTVCLYIPTVHYIGGKVFEYKEAYPDKEIVFLITACEMTLTMFADWGNMAGIKGMGIRLDGRICNTMKAFQLSEEGIKPGLTVVLDDTQERMLKWIRMRRSFENNGACVETACADFVD